LYYQNVHGGPRDNVNLSQDLQALAEYDVGCFCLSETNLDWNQSYVWSEYLSRQQKMWKYSATSFSLIDMESSSDYITGGTLTSTWTDGALEFSRRTLIHWGWDVGATKPW
jgi:hypothetical protein